MALVHLRGVGDWYHLELKGIVEVDKTQHNGSNLRIHSAFSFLTPVVSSLS